MSNALIAWHKQRKKKVLSPHADNEIVCCRRFHALFLDIIHAHEFNTSVTGVTYFN